MSSLAPKSEVADICLDSNSTFILCPHNPSTLSVIVNVRSCLLVCFSTVFSFRAKTVSAFSLGPPLMEFVVSVAEYLGYWYWYWTEGLGSWALRKDCPLQGLRHMGSWRWGRFDDTQF